MSNQPINESFGQLIQLAKEFIKQECPQSGYITMEPGSYNCLKSHSAPLHSIKTTAKPVYIAPTSTPIQTMAPKAIQPTSVEITKAPIQKQPPEPESVHRQAQQALPMPDKNEFAYLMKTHFPKLALREETPSFNPHTAPRPSATKQIPKVIILSFYEDAASQTFLKTVADAIKNKFAPCAVYSAYRIEQEKKWEPLLKSSEVKLILAPLHKMRELPGLMSYYQEPSSESIHRLHDKLLIPMLDPSQYQSDPKRKTVLWDAICKQF